jgi:hypothetical protein
MTSRTIDPANSYGAGKVMAAAVLSSVGPDTSAYHGTGDLESPDEGCALLGSGSSSPAGPLVLMSLAIVALFVARIGVRPDPDFLL